MNDLQTSAQNWQRVKTILADALERESPIERTAFIDDSCNGDTELRQETKVAAHPAVRWKNAPHTPIGPARDPSLHLANASCPTKLSTRWAGGNARFIWPNVDGQFERSRHCF
jgi:hypothetical protein